MTFRLGSSPARSAGPVEPVESVGPGAAGAEAERAMAAGRLPTAFDLLTRARATPGYEREPRLLSVWRTLARSSVRTGLRGCWAGPIRARRPHTVMD
ncbi:hypothetical protein ACWY4P_53080 [Streptomyces sp. LZ34]